MYFFLVDLLATNCYRPDPPRLAQQRADRSDADDDRHQIDATRTTAGTRSTLATSTEGGSTATETTTGGDGAASRRRMGGDGWGAGDGAATDGAPAAGSGRRASELGGRAGRAAAALWCGLGIGFQTGGVCTAGIYLMAMTPHVS